MAITKIKSIKVRLDHVIDYASNNIKTLNKDYGVDTYKSLHNVLDYIENDYKTEKRLYVTGINCNSDDAYNCMQITRNSFNKKDGILAFHLNDVIYGKTDNNDLIKVAIAQIGNIGGQFYWSWYRFNERVDMCKMKNYNINSSVILGYGITR